MYLGLLRLDARKPARLLGVSEKCASEVSKSGKIGLVESASGGTLFLDEVGDIPLPLQVKLLRLLETGTYRRVGGIETLRSDFRLLTATHRDIHGMVEAETFRRDLYHRIGTFPIHIPSLAQRREDVSLLADSLLKRVVGSRQLRLSNAAIATLEARAYPGNIRELRNLIERATILADGDEIAPTHLVTGLAQTPDGEVILDAPAATKSAFVVNEPIDLTELEMRYLRWVDERFSGDRTALAGKIGVGKRTLYRKLGALRGVREGVGTE